MNPKDFKKVLDPILYNDFDLYGAAGFSLKRGMSINTPKFRGSSIPILSKIVSLLFSKKLRMQQMDLEHLK